MKFLFRQYFIFLTATFKLSAIESIPITCDFGYNTKLQDLTALYCCKVISYLSISERNQNICSLTNSQQQQQQQQQQRKYSLPDLSSVQCFNIDGREMIYDKKSVVNYIPSGIDLIFSNLKHLRIGDVFLKEVNNEDLKPFNQLTAISFFYNDIELIEKDLFIYNPHLEFIWLEKNKIKQIWPTVFDHLTELTNLCLLNNKCVNTQAINSKNKVNQVIKELKGNHECINSEYMTTHYPEIYNEWMELKRTHELYVLIGVGIVLLFIVGTIIGGVLCYKRIKYQRMRRRSLPQLPVEKSLMIQMTVEGDPRYSVMRANLNHIYDELDQYRASNL